MRNGSSLFGLVRELKHEVKIFIREEIRLAKTELGEKISCFGGNSAAVAIGGFVAYAGLIVLLAGLGAVLAFAFSRLDLPPLLAAFIGLSIIGLIVIGAGTIMLMKGIKQLKNQSFAPERTIESLQHLRGSRGGEIQPKETTPKEKRSAREIEACVLRTEDKMAETIEELADRVTLGHFRRKARLRVRSHPYRWGLVAAGCGAAGSYMLKKKLAK